MSDLNECGEVSTAQTNEAERAKSQIRALSRDVACANREPRSEQRGGEYMRARK